MPRSVATVTGASQGIGHSTAIRLARDFSSIVLVARSRVNLEGTAEAVKAAGPRLWSSTSTLPNLRPHRRWSIRP